MAKALNEGDVLRILGKDPAQIDRELAEFSETARAFSTDHPRFIDDYPHQWVGVFRGSVEARGNTLKSVIVALEEKGIPPESALIRLIERNDRTFIL